MATAKTATKPAAKTFSKGDRVSFKLHTGRADKGVIDHVQSGARGAFYAVKNAAGEITKVRAGQLTAA